MGTNWCITLTHEPVPCVIFFVFEELRKQARDALLSDRRQDTDDVIDAPNRFLRADNGIANPTCWFDTALRVCIGIEVFVHPYDLKHSHTLTPSEKTLVPIAFAATKVGACIGYANALARVKQSCRISPDITAAALDTRYVRHFYGNDLEMLRVRWT